MRILPDRPTTRASSDTFIGDAWFDTIVRGEAPSRVRASLVRFAPGARNSWHVHAVGQTLHVTDGVGRVQARGGELLEVRAGDTIVTAPGEWHWHGAAPDRFMSHLTVYEAADDGAETDWGEPVPDEVYLAQPSGRR
jgi:quercetin dioxygenase-like cupin family protein